MNFSHDCGCGGLWRLWQIRLVDALNRQNALQGAVDVIIGVRWAWRRNRHKYSLRKWSWLSVGVEVEKAMTLVVDIECHCVV